VNPSRQVVPKLKDEEWKQGLINLIQAPPAWLQIQSAGISILRFFFPISPAEILVKTAFLSFRFLQVLLPDTKFTAGFAI